MTRKETREERFCHEYVIDLNGTRAAIASGFTENRASARVIAARLLADVNVKARIDQLTKEQLQNLDISIEWTLGQMRKLAGFDAASMFDEDGNLIPMDQWTPDIRQAVAGLEFEEIFEGRGEDRVHVGTLRKVKLVDKTKALEMLGRWQKLFTDKTELSGTNGGAVEHTIRFGGGVIGIGEAR